MHLFDKIIKISVSRPLQVVVLGKVGGTLGTGDFLGELSLVPDTWVQEDKYGPVTMEVAG